METTWCILVVLLSPIAIGVPVVWALRGFRALERSSWLLAPFAGLSFTILLLQNLVYFNWQIAQTAFIVWFAAGIGWIGIVWRRQLRYSFATAPVWIFLMVVAVYLVQGAGLLRFGVEQYMGRSQIDQF